MTPEELIEELPKRAKQRVYSFIIGYDYYPIYLNGRMIMIDGWLRAPFHQSKKEWDWPEEVRRRLNRLSL